MNKKLKENFAYVLAAIVMVILPILVLNFFESSRRERFHRYVTEDHQDCRESALQDSRDAVWCDEIRNSARLAYSEAEGSSNLSQLFILIQPLLFVLLISLYHLGKQVKELKEKIDG